MTRQEYKSELLKKGFVFVKTQKGYPSRGDEDVYSHPGFKHQFYVTRFKKNDDSLYGFYTGERNGDHLERLASRNEPDEFRQDKEQSMWAGDTFVELMGKLRS